MTYENSKINMKIEPFTGLFNAGATLRDYSLRFVVSQLYCTR